MKTWLSLGTKPGTLNGSTTTITWCIKSPSCQRYVLECSVALFELFVMNELNGNKDICLGFDSTSTYFDRSVTEVHATGYTCTELLAPMDTLGKGAEDALNDVLLVVERINEVEKRFNAPCTPLYFFTSLTTDTTSSMSGEFSGLQALLEVARVKAWEQDGKPDVWGLGEWKPLTYKQCDDHVTNLVRALFNRQLISFAQESSHLWLIYERRFGSPIAFHYQLIRRIAKELLTRYRSQFAVLRAASNFTFGKLPPRKLELQRTPFNRFATFQQTAESQHVDGQSPRRIF